MVKEKKSTVKKQSHKGQQCANKGLLKPKNCIAEGSSILCLLPAIFFSACVIIITKMYTYQRDMGQFVWSGESSVLKDFFCYYKAVAILMCAVVAFIFILYKLFTKTLSVKHFFGYIPMGIYSLMVIVSYLTSDYKEFSLLGYNDRFEGTVVLLAYMVMLFFVINFVNSEYNVKCILYPIGVSSAVLGMIGISQATNHDFFRTTIGQKLIVKNSTFSITEEFMASDMGKSLSEAGLIKETVYTSNELIDMCHSIGIQFLDFRFQGNEIYQTVFNINYVSFYLTLLLPIIAMLFIYATSRGNDIQTWKKVVCVCLFALLFYNLIGSASASGWIGLAVAVVVALILFNVKIVKWWKPVAVLMGVVVIIGGITFNIWSEEFSMGSNNTDEISTISRIIPVASADEAKGKEVHNLQYIDTTGNDIIIGIDGNILTVTTYPKNPIKLKIKEQSGKNVELMATGEEDRYVLNDERFNGCSFTPMRDKKGKNYYMFECNEQKWGFMISEDGVLYLNHLGKLVDLDIVPSIGWEDNQSFGSGRGYIFSRAIPMMKETAIIGHGADTFCIYFPQTDYVGKYNSGTFSDNIDIVVDKAHNMYLGAWIGTGGVSAVALVALFGGYLIQSIGIYFRNPFKNDDFISFAGVGIFLGIVGFLVAGLVNDSSVSVMPMFYTLLGTGISINMMLRNKAIDFCQEKVE